MRGAYAEPTRSSAERLFEKPCVRGAYAEPKRIYAQSVFRKCRLRGGLSGAYASLDGCGYKELLPLQSEHHLRGLF